MLLLLMGLVMLTVMFLLVSLIALPLLRVRRDWVDHMVFTVAAVPSLALAGTAYACCTWLVNQALGSSTTSPPLFLHLGWLVVGGTIGGVAAVRFRQRMLAKAVSSEPVDGIGISPD